MQSFHHVRLKKCLFSNQTCILRGELAQELDEWMDRTGRIPVRINPCPILEALLEIRFETSLGDAIFGMFYGQVRHDVKSATPLPTSQIPEAFRNQDSNLRYQPTHRLEIDDHFTIQIGPKVLSFSVINNYPGWDKYNEFIDKYLSLFMEMKAIDSFKRIGLRYISFFKEINIFDHINLKLSLNDASLADNDMQLRAMHRVENIQTTLSIINNASVGVGENSNRGSVIDIDTFIEEGVDPNNISSIISRLHEEERIVFFNLPTNAFLATMNPEY